MKSGVLHKPAVIPGLYQPVYILPAGEPIPAAHNSLTDNCICIPADLLYQTDCNQQIHSLVSGNRRFILYLDKSFSSMTDKKGRKTLLEKLSLLLLSKNYMADDNTLPIAVPDTDMASIDDFKKELTTMTAAQGMNDIAWYNIPTSLSFEQQTIAGRHPLYIENKHEITPGSIQFFFANPDNYGKPIFFSDQNMETGNAENQLQLAYAEYLQENSSMKIAVERLVDTTKNLQQLSKENALLLQRLANANSFVELAKSKYKKDYDTLFTFYQHEYEILPLWYKRFGHIIKVLMGKRSFRSLFNDNVKKYRD